MYECFKAGSIQSEPGASVDQVMEMLRKRGCPLPRVQLDGIIAGLTNEAVLYSTTDDMHFRPTDDSF